MRPKPSNVVVRPYASQIQPYNDEGITPRSARAKFEPNQSQDHDEIDLLPEQQQSQPLLASSSASRFVASTPYQAAYGRPKPPIRTRILNNLRRIPLALGILVALILVFLAVLSYSKPELLVNTVSGTETPAAHPSHHPSSSEPINEKNVISYANYSKFPLEPIQYATECWTISKMTHDHIGYWKVPSSGIMDVPHRPLTSRHCSSTITYQLDKYAGLTAHLAILAQVAAIARQRNRTLLIEDSYWDRGKWTDHFLDVRTTQPGPEPGCLPPPPRELVACPRLARHWVVNSRTAKFHLRHGFEDEYHDAYAMDVDRLRPVYKQALKSFEDTIIPSDRNVKLIDMARREVGHSPYVGIHMRRGDRKASSFRFHGGYVPMEDFAKALQRTWATLKKANPTLIPDASSVWIGSDSQDSVRQFKTLLPFGAKTYSLAESVKEDLRSLVPLQEYIQKQWTSLPLDRRVKETRGMIVDFALMNGAWPSAEEKVDIWPESVICTLTSNVCKLSALFFGFDPAFKENVWVEIDNAGTVEPIWEAFETF